jgi:signal transduction histidine kinase
VTARRADALLAAAGVTVAVGSVVIWGGGALGIAAAAALGGALGIARRSPRSAWLVATAALLVTASDGTLLSPAYLVVTAHAFCAGRWDGRWSGISGLLALIGASELGAALSHEPGVPYILFPAAAWGAGRALREREVVALQLAERARELEEEREAHAALSVRFERARIASELHDIVAHAISVMVVQASAGQRLAARDPERTAETFEAIAGAAHQAEEDMGRLVALLADEEASGPAPDLVLIEELVDRAAGSGLEVNLRLEGDREGMPSRLTEVAYRVVQEGLTNSFRYASGAAVSVLVRGDPKGLVVQVDNEAADREVALAGVGTGNGIIGLRERVGALGGTLEASPRAEGGWRLHASLPRQAATAPSQPPVT